MTTLNTTPEIKSDSNLKPFSKEVELIFHREYHTISVSPNILMEVMKDDPTTFLPPDWELTQTMFDELMEYSIDDDFYEGDLHDISWFIDNELYGGKYEYEDVNQKWLWEHKIKYSLCSSINIVSIDRRNSTSYFTPKVEYGGLGNEFLIKQLKTDIKLEMNPYVDKLNQLEEME